MKISDGNQHSIFLVGLYGLRLKDGKRIFLKVTGHWTHGFLLFDIKQ